MGATWRDQWTKGSSVVFQLNTVSDQQKELLPDAFAALGIHRVVAGARALFLGDHGWEDCFLALAYGEAGELQRVVLRAVPAQLLADDPLAEDWGWSHSVSRILGISVEDVDFFSLYFSSNRKDFTAQLVQWLQARGVNAAVVLAGARREADAERLRLALEREASRVRPGHRRAEKTLPKAALRTANASPQAINAPTKASQKTTLPNR
jgi:hypothetical protein